MGPVRILHVLGKLNRGGAETLVMNWYRNIDRSKIQFDFVIHTTEKCSYTNEVLALGGRIFSVPEYRGINHIQYCQAWKNLFEQHSEFKIVHGHVRSTAAIYLFIAKKYNRIAISHSHAINNGSGIGAIIKNAYQYPVRYIADYQWACSMEAGEFLFGKDVLNHKNYSLIKNAIDVKRFEYNSVVRQEIRNELEIGNKLVFGHVGRFTFEKNHEFLLGLFENYHKINNDSILIFVGIGPLLNNVKAIVMEKNLQDAVMFLGEREDVDRLLQGIDLFLFPSLFEGLGIVAIEAQAADLPVLISNRVPADVLILKDTKVCSIDSVNSKEIWLETIKEMNLSTRNRVSRAEELIHAGYDISVEAKTVQRKYLNIIKNKG